MTSADAPPTPIPPSGYGPSPRCATSPSSWNAQQVRRARELGWSWREIALRLDVTKQAVHQKYAAAMEDRRAMHERMVERAQQWALRSWHNYVGCEHLLLVLADDGALTPVRGHDGRRRARAAARRSPAG